MRGRPYERRPDFYAPDTENDGRTLHLVDKLFTESRAGIVGKQTAGSQTMFQVLLSRVVAGCCNDDSGVVRRETHMWRMMTCLLVACSRCRDLSQ